MHGNRGGTIGSVIIIIIEMIIIDVRIFIHAFRTSKHKQ